MMTKAVSIKLRDGTLKMVEPYRALGQDGVVRKEFKYEATSKHTGEKLVCFSRGLAEHWLELVAMCAVRQ